MTEAFLKAIDTGDLPALGPEQRASAKPIAGQKFTWTPPDAAARQSLGLQAEQATPKP